MGEGIGAIRVLVRRPERKRPLGSPRCAWKDNSEMEFVKERADLR
jgi:hypothetical protein